MRSLVLSLVLLQAIQLAACTQFLFDVDEQKYMIHLDIVGGELSSIDPEDKSESMWGGARKGAGVGGAAGAFTALGCGPFVVVCFPIFTAAGVVIGSGTGAMIGESRGISENSLKALNEALDNMNYERDIRQEIFNQVIVRIPEEVQASREEANLLGKLELIQIDVRYYKNNMIDLLLNVGLEVKVVEEKLGLKQSKELEQQLFYVASRYHCSTPQREVDEWLHDEENTLDQALTNCIEEVSTSISTALNRVLSE